MSDATETLENIPALLATADRIRDEMEALQARLARIEFPGRSAQGAVSVRLDHQGALVAADVGQVLLDGGDRAEVGRQLLEAHAEARAKLLNTSAAEMDRLATRWLVPPEG